MGYGEQWWGREQERLPEFYRGSVCGGEEENQRRVWLQSDKRLRGLKEQQLRLAALRRVVLLITARARLCRASTAERFRGIDTHVGDGGNARRCHPHNGGKPKPGTPLEAVGSHGRQHDERG